MEIFQTDVFIKPKAKFDFFHKLSWESSCCSAVPGLIRIIILAINYDVRQSTMMDGDDFVRVASGLIKGSYFQHFREELPLSIKNLLEIFNASKILFYGWYIIRDNECSCDLFEGSVGYQHLHSSLKVKLVCSGLSPVRSLSIMDYQFSYFNMGNYWIHWQTKLWISIMKWKVSTSFTIQDFLFVFHICLALCWNWYPNDI